MLHITPWTGDWQFHEMGNVIQLRHFYRDPPLTKCSIFQTQHAGQAMRKWLVDNRIKLDFLAASRLTRTFETAYFQLVDGDNSSWPDYLSEDVLKGDGAPRVSQMPFVNEFDEKWGYQAD